MKEITLQIPEGKKAKWINGVLTLVDDKPKDITERIKTFEDACYELGDEHPLVIQYRLTSGAYKGDPMTEDFIAYLKLRVICAALNEGWQPTFDNKESRYYPCFYIYTKPEYKKINEDEKKKYRDVDLVCYNVFRTASSSSFHLHARLALKTEELAVYCGRQFDDIWAEFLIK